MFPLIAFTLADQSRSDVHRELRLARENARARAAASPARDVRWADTVTRLATRDEYAEAAIGCTCATA